MLGRPATRGLAAAAAFAVLAAAGAGPAGATPAGPAAAAGAARAPAAAEGPRPAGSGTRAASAPPVRVLGETVRPGERRTLALVASESFLGSSLATPVIVVRGTAPGPTLCLTAGIHGDEVNGVEIVRQVVERTDPERLAGTVVAVPIVNLHGFRRGSRYLPDRRDLNRYFPGNPTGSSAARIAHALFDGVVRFCDAVVDFHTGSFHRTNLPQIRADLRDPRVVDLALAFGSEIVVHSVGTAGTLRRAAVEAGIPAITYEAGEPLRFRESEVARGVEGVERLMQALGMRQGAPGERMAHHVFYRSRWVRVDDGGILRARVGLGAEVAAGEVLGEVVDPITNERALVRAPERGRVIGMAVDQVVIPGYAAFHLGVMADPANAAGFTDEESAEDGLAAENRAPDDTDATASEHDERPEE